MARLRRTSSVLETARQRHAGLKTLDPEPNFGPTLSRAAYEALITSFSGRLDTYNQHVAALDDEQNALEAVEGQLLEMSKRMLSATGAHYGEDSSEYEVVGGTRTSERKKRKAAGSKSSTS